MQKSIQNRKVVILGSGNVATHLSLALQQNGFEIVQLFGRNPVSVAELSEKLNHCATTHNTQDITTNADIYFFALNDEGVLSVAKELQLNDKIVVHCAGSLPMDILNGISSNHGVFYPLYTFVKNIPVDFKNVPVCVEASNETTGKTLMEIAKILSRKTEWIDSEKRKIIHLSAVFVSNFTNMINTAAYDILSKNNIDFSLLQPLIQETLQKTTKGNPFQFQTGPAVRNDQKTLQMHLEMLEGFPVYEKLYEELTTAIQKTKTQYNK